MCAFLNATPGREKGAAAKSLPQGSDYIHNQEETIFSWQIRSRREGDKLTLGERPSKTVKKLMIEGRVPAPRRERVPVLARGERAAAVGGFGPERDCLASPGAPALHIILKEEENVL